MPIRSHLEEDDIIDLVHDFERGASIARLCRTFSIGRERCRKIVEQHRFDDAAAGAGAGAGLFGRRAAEAGLSHFKVTEPARRYTAHFWAEEPPEPEVADTDVPILVDESTKPKKTKKKTDTTEQVEIAKEVQKVNEAGMALQVGSDDSKTVEAGLEALSVLRKKRAVTPKAAAAAEQSLKASRHGEGADPNAGVAAAAMTVGGGREYRRLLMSRRV